MADTARGPTPTTDSWKDRKEDRRRNQTRKKQQWENTLAGNSLWALNRVGSSTNMRTENETAPLNPQPRPTNFLLTSSSPSSTLLTLVLTGVQSESRNTRIRSYLNCPLNDHSSTTSVAAARGTVSYCFHPVSIYIPMRFSFVFPTPHPTPSRPVLKPLL